MADWDAAPPIVFAAYRRSMDTLRILHDAADPISIRPSVATSPCMTRKKPISIGPYSSDDEEDKHARKSIGSMTGREDLDWQRHTFAAMPSSLCELARRSTEDDAGSLSLPPRSAPVSSSRKGSHVQHLRVYGRPIDATGLDQVRENDQAGDPFVEVMNPDPATVWTRGKAAGIEWNILDSTVTHIKIELLERGSAATTVICKEAPNNGGFLYTKVPWGMAIGDKYFLRISCTSDPSRFMTTCLFAISSAP